RQPKRLTRVQFNHERFVDIVSDIGAIGVLLVYAGVFLGVYLDPLWQASLFGQLECLLDTHLRARSFTDADDITGLDEQARDISTLTVDLDCTVGDQLTCFGASRAKAHAVDHIVQTGLEQLDQDFTCVTTATISFSEVAAELSFQNAIHTL